MQDYIAMVLIWLATEQSSTAKSDLQRESLAEKLNLLESLLDSNTGGR